MQADPYDLVAALALLPPDTKLTITVEAGALRQAIEAARGGPEVLSTRQCAETFGWTSTDWRRWAPEIPGARRVGKGWRIPRTGAKAKADQLMKRERGELVPRIEGGPRRGGNYGKFRSLKDSARISDKTPGL